jgi:hypothetical protein
MHVNLRTLPTLADGRLDRALRHARGCDRCRGPVERAILATRALEQGTPWEPTEAEFEARLRRGLPTVQALAPCRPRWPILGAIGFAAAAVATFVWIRPTEFAERGTGEGRAVLRMFCATPEPGSLRELAPGGRCPAGHALAFAAGAQGELTSVAVKLHDSSGTRVLGPFTVSGRPGSEVPLEATPELRAAGLLEVTAAFARSPEAALSALLAAPAPGTVLVRQSATIEAGP